jgi:hypothetical protein
MSAFVAVGALFGVKVFWRDSKHIVALNADAMNDRLRVWSWLRFDVLVGHEGNFITMTQSRLHITPQRVT